MMGSLYVLEVTKRKEVQWRARNAEISLRVPAANSDRRQRRIATGITARTDRCKAGSSANDSSTTQSMRASGIARTMSVTTGSAWITSPIELVLIRAMRTGPV